MVTITTKWVSAVLVAGLMVFVGRECVVTIKAKYSPAAWLVQDAALAAEAVALKEPIR